MSLADYQLKGKLLRGIVGAASYLLKGQSATIVYTNAGVPVNGTTLANIASKGSLLIDTTNAVLYQNTNTLASPTWTALTTATGAGTYTGTFDGVVGGTTPAAGTFTAVTTTGINTDSVATALTASTTQTRAGGLALTKAINNVATVANAGDAVTLPALSPGQSCIVYNAAATNSMKVFPNGASDTIDGGSGGASVNLAAGKRAVFTCLATNTLVSAQLGAVSA